MSQQITSISLEGIQYLCKCINQLASVSEAINNTNLADDKVFSNLYTKKLIDKCLEDANTEAQKLVGALTHLTCEETTVQPTLNNSTINVIYLYSADGNAPYQQYLKISDTKLIDLGSTTISLSDYLTATQIASTYTKQINFDALKTEVDGKVDKTDIVNNLTSTDTDKPLSANQGKVLKDEVDLKANDSDVVKKTDIVTTIDSASTDDKTPSAKAVYDNMKNKNTIQPSGTISNYSTVFDWAVNNVGASCGYEGNMFDDCPLNNTWGTLVCIGTKVESGLKVLFCTNFNKDIYIRTIQRRNGVNAWVTSWQRVCTTTVEDTSLKKLKNSSDINSDADITYIVKNGMCNVSVNTLSSTKMETGNIALTTGLPIPVNPSCWYSLSTNSNATTATLQNLLIRIDPSGNMIAYKGTNNVNYFGSFSYPVAE